MIWKERPLKCALHLWGICLHIQALLITTTTTNGKILTTASTHVLHKHRQMWACDAQCIAANKNNFLKKNSNQDGTNLGIFCLDGAAAWVDVLAVQTVLSLSSRLDVVKLATDGQEIQQLIQSAQRTQNTLTLLHSVKQQRRHFCAYICVFCIFVYLNLHINVNYIYLYAKAGQHWWACVLCLLRQPVMGNFCYVIAYVSAKFILLIIAPKFLFNTEKINHNLTWLLCTVHEKFASNISHTLSNPPSVPGHAHSTQAILASSSAKSTINSYL